jgi:pimeloyl-ACP methyl ester carboxylesterase
VKRLLGAALAACASAALLAPAYAQSVRAGKTAGGIAYDVRGSGPAVVLLTGSNLDRRMWAREAEWLSKTYMVVRYDLRAHGESDTATTEFSHLADLVGVLDALKVEKATLIGLSAGSAIALEAALDVPARVERIVLAGPAIGGFVSKVPAPFPPELMPAIQAREYRKVSEILLTTPVFAAPPESQALVRQMVFENERLWTVDRALMKNPAQPASARLESVRVPTLVLIGDKDVSQKEHADALAARVPGARIVRIPGGGHLLNLTSPKEFDAAVREFLSGR